MINTITQRNAVGNKVDKQKIAHYFAKAQHSYEQSATVQHRINQQLIALLAQQSQPVKRLLEIGCGTGHLTRLLLENHLIERGVLNDLYLSENIAFFCQQHRAFTFITADAEQYPFTGRFDLIVSASAVQWFNQPLDFIKKSSDLLEAKGRLLFSTFAPDNLTEITTLTQTGLNYPSLTQWRQALQAQFEIIELQEETHQLLFDTPLAVLQHLKQTGVTATNHQIWTKKTLQAFSHAYRQHFTKGQQVTLTYRPIYCLALRK